MRARYANADAGTGSAAATSAWIAHAVDWTSEPRPAVNSYLARMRRPDGSYRYSAAYGATPVWVTAQALAALARKPLPIRPS